MQTLCKAVTSSKAWPLLTEVALTWRRRSVHAGDFRAQNGLRVFSLTFQFSSLRLKKPALFWETTECLGLFPLTETVTIRGHRNYDSPLMRPPLRTVTGWGNDPTNAPGPRRWPSHQSSLKGHSTGFRA